MESISKYIPRDYQENNRELILLYRFQKAASFSEDLSELYEIIVNYFLQLLQMKEAGLYLYNFSTNHLEFRHCNSENRQLFVDLKSVLAETTELNESYKKVVEITHQGKQFFAKNIFNDNRSYGFVLFESQKGNENWFGLSDLGMIDVFAQDCADAIENGMEVLITKQKLREMSSLYDVGKIISSTLNLDDLLVKIMTLSTQVMNCETGSVFMVDHKTNELYFTVALGEQGDAVKEIRLKMGEGIAGWVAETRKSVIVPDCSVDPRFSKKVDKKSAFVTKSLICVPLVSKDKTIGVLQVLNRKGDLPFSNEDLELVEALGTLAVNAIENSILYQNINSLYLSTVKVLANAMDAKDPYTQGHSRRVAVYSVAIAEEMGVDENEVKEIELAALLHDIGKIGIRDNILCKPGRLTDEEFDIIKTHPSISAQILEPIDFLASKIPSVKYHHEKFDGRGYPEGLSGEEIPFGARIIAVADTFDAMTSHRAYRKGLDAEIALAEIERCKSTQFDPVMADAFLRAFEKKFREKFEEFRSSFEEQDSVI